MLGCFSKDTQQWLVSWLNMIGMLAAVVLIMIKLVHFFGAYGSLEKHRDDITDYDNHQGINNGKTEP